MSNGRARGTRHDVRSLAPAHLAAWREMLLASDPDGDAFRSATFFEAAARAYRQVYVCVLEDGNAVSAFLPFQFSSGFASAFGAGERVGEEMSDSFGLVARSGFVCQPDDLLAAAGLNHLYFTHLRSDQSRHGLSGERENGGLRIAMPEGGAAYWRNLELADPKFTKDTERRVRKAERDLGAMRFRIEEERPADWIPRILEAKRDQYLRTGKGDWLAQPGRRELIASLAGGGHDECRVVVSTLAFGETWAAMHLGLRSRTTLHYWLPVYNPTLAAYAPGRLLLQHVILNADAVGLRHIDRGTGETKAKQDFPSERRTYFSGAWYRRGLRSTLYRAYLSAQWRLSEARAGAHSDASQESKL